MPANSAAADRSQEVMTILPESAPLSPSASRPGVRAYGADRKAPGSPNRAPSHGAQARQSVLASLVGVRRSSVVETQKSAGALRATPNVSYRGYVLRTG